MDAATDLTLQDLIDSRVQVQAGAMQWVHGLTGVPGLHNTTKRGQGLEFDDLRAYLEGDDIRHIDWNVTARSGKAHVRLFREERERTVTVVLDLNPSMFTGTHQLRAVTACRASALILWHVAATGARCALVVSDGTRLDLSRPAPGERGALAACAKIADAFAIAREQASLNVTTLPVTGLLDWIIHARHDTGLALLVSALDDAGPDWQIIVSEAGRRQRLALLWIRDQVEVDGLPPGHYRYRRGEHSAQLNLTRQQATALSQSLAQRNRQMQDQCRQWQVPMAIYTGDTGAQQTTVHQALSAAGA